MHFDVLISVDNPLRNNYKHIKRYFVSFHKENVEVVAKLFVYVLLHFWWVAVSFSLCQEFSLECWSSLSDSS